MIRVLQRMLLPPVVFSDIYSMLPAVWRSRIVGEECAMQRVWGGVHRGHAINGGASDHETG